MVIKSFTQEYQSEVKKLIANGLVEHWGYNDSTLNQDLNDISKSYDVSNFLVAIVEGKVVGTGALIHKSQNIAEIVRMSVNKDYRRNGIGKQILEQLHKKAISLGYKEIILETTANWKDVISFYCNYGFKITHEEIGEFGSDTYFSLKLN